MEEFKVKVKRSLLGRLLWLAFGLLLGLPQLWFGLQHGAKGELLFGIGMLIIGIRGFLRPVLLSAMRGRMQPGQNDDISIGSPALHGLLTLVILIGVVGGLVIKMKGF